jgi:hypothetical protein
VDEQKAAADQHLARARNSVAKAAALVRLQERTIKRQVDGGYHALATRSQQLLANFSQRRRARIAGTVQSSPSRRASDATSSSAECIQV